MMTEKLNTIDCDTIAIYLATYNGEKYIDKQVQPILIHSEPSDEKQSRQSDYESGD